MKFDTNPEHLNLEALAKANQPLEGHTAQDKMPRLSLEPHTTVDWQAEASAVNDKIWLDLQAACTLNLVCQRCLQPMAWPLDVSRRYLFVGDEEYAATLDADLEESADFDVLPHESKINLLELIEDELVMDTPYAPMHEECPANADAVKYLFASGDKADAEDAVAETKPNPFAVLEKLRKDK